MSNINLFSEFNDEQEQDRHYKNGHAEKKEDELIVFGYSCKLFRDDFSAKAIDRGQSLIPWNGDENVMIDRYDCRGHLFDLTPWDSDLIRNKASSTNLSVLTEAERRMEEECERERYIDLYKDMEKEALQKEEEAKRLAVDKSAYNQVGFSYQDDNKTKDSTNTSSEDAMQPLENDEYEPFYPSEKLQIPYGMEIPESKKLNAVIEKTANFVLISGHRMESVLKDKQANNPQFDFLKYDHYLNPYYRHLLSMIKSGKYRPNLESQSNTNSQKDQVNKNGVDQNNSHDDDDDGGDSYLHPLLRGGAGSSSDSNLSSKKTEEPVRIPSVSINIHDTAYGELIKKYEHLRQREKVKKENEEEKKLNTATEEAKPEESSPRPQASSALPTVIPPPPDVKPVIDKLAEYVARHGTAFEKSIRNKNDPRFAFLESDHIHYNYYQLKLKLSSQENKANTEEENQKSVTNTEITSNCQSATKLVLPTNSDGSLTPNSCHTLQSDEDSNLILPNEADENCEFIGPRPPSPEFLEKLRKQEQRRDRINEFVRDKLVRDKQEERKRKAELLIQKLKTQNTDITGPSTVNLDTGSSSAEKINKINNETTSPSIAVSSPKTTSFSKQSRSTSKSRSRSKYHRRSRSRSRSRTRSRSRSRSRSKYDRRRTRRSSRKRSRTRSKSRSRYRSKRSKNSKSTRRSRDRRHRRHRRRHYHDSSSESTASSRSRSKRSSSRSSSSSSSVHEGKKNKSLSTEHVDQSRTKSQSKKWDQREPIHTKQDPANDDITTSSVTTNQTSLSSNSIS